MRITLLGTGTPTPSLKRMSSGYLLRIGEDVILLDHGPGCYHRMMQAGVQATEVSHVFFSHLHYDHCLDYGRLLITRWDQGGDLIPDLRVYGPPHTRRMHDSLFGPDGAFGPDIAARTEHPMSVGIYHARGGQGTRPHPAPEIIELQNRDRVEGNGWTVKTASVRHAQPYLHCFGYRVESPAGTLVYSGDAGPDKALENLAREADVLIHMCQYLSGSELNEAYAESCMGHLELAALGKTANVANLVISHVTKQMDVPGIRERIIAEMAEIYPGNIFFGEDLMEIPIKVPKPAKLN
ncbi:MAG: MBL fold metallo-hydrolase [Alphaproteobacteria bacterium]|jgi:ribonuclease BN (tRNA processing enzyme)|nr:MBL fold metallo-hydrolase [Alphaproteobacteria bacterium]MDP7191625.1 MBL fold metallo-hydrolase [Alphaproteobacteria bacterium]|tara:strand:- start:202 stop:1086 length:885 start_codon:yes stop_codon:yes gene_type:complete